MLLDVGCIYRVEVLGIVLRCIAVHLCSTAEVKE